jgi:hypothetical protein
MVLVNKYVWNGIIRTNRKIERETEKSGFCSFDRTAGSYMVTENPERVRSKAASVSEEVGVNPFTG